jgi:hypothetical protein
MNDASFLLYNGKENRKERGIATWQTRKIKKAIHSPRTAAQ